MRIIFIIMFNIYMIIIIIIIIFIILLIYNNCVTVEHLNTFNGRMAIDDQYFYDKLFDDVVYYPNKYEKDYDTGEEIGKLLETGWIRCLSECKGNCVEYGLTGHTYCFPKLN